MSERQHSGFGQFIPGFEFLQNLAKSAPPALPQMPSLSSWIAPTLSVEELEKRIGDLKAVQFWLEQNSAALGATIQALEVQKMTLATLRGMNLSMAEVAESMKFKPGTAAAAPATKGAKAAPAGKASRAGKRAAAGDEAAKVVDPLQWWGALTQQFQQIAATAMQDVAASAAEDSKPPPPSAAPAAQPPAPGDARAARAPTKTRRTARKTPAAG